MLAPENALESAMLRAAAADNAAILDFYRLLLESELIVLGTAGERLALDTLKNETGFFHPVFTSETRLGAFGQSDAKHFKLPGRRLFETTLGGQFLINPKSALAKMLFANEIAWCLENFRSTNYTIYQPVPYPAKLVKALCVLFASRSQLHSARIVYVEEQNANAGVRILIGIEADGDIPRLAEEIFAAASAATPSHPVDVVYITPDRVRHPLQQHLLSVQPFYKRAFINQQGLMA